MESQEVPEIGKFSDYSCTLCKDGLERQGSVVKGSENLGVDLLDDLDSYWEDINDRLMISRMVNDSVIKGMVNAVEQDAADKISAKELEIASLKKSLNAVNLDMNKIDEYEPESINYGQYLSLSDDCMEYDIMRKSLGSLKCDAREQFNRLKKEIDGIRGCNSIRRNSSGSELVGLGGILKEKENESWAGLERTLDSLKMTVATIITRVEDMLQLSKTSLGEWRQEWMFQRELEAMVMQSLIRSLQEEFEEKLREKNSCVWGSQSVNWLEKFDEISSLRKELDTILKVLTDHENGHLSSHGSLDVVLSHHKSMNNHISFSASLWEGNGKVDESHVPGVFDAAQFKHMKNEELVNFFKTIMSNYRRHHESTVQQMAEEIIGLKGKYLSERGSSLPHRKDKEFDMLKKKIPEVILKLDDIIVDNEKLPAFSDSNLGNLKDRLDNLLSENIQLRDSLTEKKNEVKFLSAQVSDAAEKFLQHSSSEANLRLLRNLNSSAEDARIEALLSEDIYKCVLRELGGHIKSDSEELEMKSIIVQEIYEIIFREASQSGSTSQFEIEDSRMESLIMQETYGFIFGETIKDAIGKLKDLYQEYVTEKEQRASLEMKILEKENDLRLEVEEKEILQQQVILLAHMMEEKEKLAAEASNELLKKSKQIELAFQELNELRDQTKRQEQIISLTGKDLYRVEGELKEALKQIRVDKMEIESLDKNLDLQMQQLQEADELRKKVLALNQDRENDLSLFEAKEKEQRKQLESVKLLVQGLSKQLTQLEDNVAEDINTNNLRLKISWSMLKSLIQKAHKYKQRLERRCSDLHKAEAEVDLLGDEVETLLSLLEKIYIALDHYSPVLQHYPGIIEILKLVRRELSGESTKSV